MDVLFEHLRGQQLRNKYNTIIKLLTIQCSLNCTLDTDVMQLVLMMIRYQLRALY